jgi:hypothetical protein
MATVVSALLCPNNPLHVFDSSRKSCLHPAFWGGLDLNAETVCDSEYCTSEAIRHNVSFLIKEIDTIVSCIRFPHASSPLPPLTKRGFRCRAYGTDTLRPWQAGMNYLCWKILQSKNRESCRKGFVAVFLVERGWCS